MHNEHQLGFMMYLESTKGGYASSVSSKP